MRLEGLINLIKNIISASLLLSLITTPIGNLEDLTLRNIRTIFNCDILLCEDTRVSKKLIHLIKNKFDLETFGIREKEQQFISLHSHNETGFLQNIDVDFFRQNVGYMCDAGMPCISDPAHKLVAFCHQNNIEVQIIPGATAFSCAYALSGFSNPHFSFYGFLNNKKGRLETLEKIMSGPSAAILYESPKRINKLLDEIESIDSKRTLFLIKEITKIHETKFLGMAFEIKARIKDYRGEWVVVIEGSAKAENGVILNNTLNASCLPKEKAKNR